MSKLDEEGTVIAVLDRLRLQRLPVALALKEKVDAGGKLDSLDIALLEQQLAEARDVGPVADRHPELQEFASRLVSLYLEITAKALDNERQS